MKTKISFFIALVTVFLTACNSRTADSDNSLLIGTWHYVEDKNQVVSISENMIDIFSGWMQYKYTCSNGVLHVERLSEPEGAPHRKAECPYTLKQDTLRIDNFLLSLVETYPSTYGSITLVK